MRSLPLYDRAVIRQYDCREHRIFKQLNLVHDLRFAQKFQYILIYFDENTRKRVIHTLLDNLKPDGNLFMGLSESILGTYVAVCLYDIINHYGDMNHFIMPTIPEGINSSKYGDASMHKLISLFIHTGSSIHSLEAKLFGGAAHEGSTTAMEIAGSVPDAYVARQKIISLKPDVLILDIEMPRMDGITFLKNLMKSFPLPVIIVSSLLGNQKELSMTALEIGAVDVVPKPDPYSVGDIVDILVDKIRAAEDGVDAENLLS